MKNRDFQNSFRFTVLSAFLLTTLTGCPSTPSSHSDNNELESVVGQLTLRPDALNQAEDPIAPSPVVTPPGQQRPVPTTTPEHTPESSVSGSMPASLHFVRVPLQGREHEFGVRLEFKVHRDHEDRILFRSELINEAQQPRRITIAERDTPSESLQLFLNRIHLTHPTPGEDSNASSCSLRVAEDTTTARKTAHVQFNVDRTLRRQPGDLREGLVSRFTVEILSHHEIRFARGQVEKIKTTQVRVSLIQRGPDGEDLVVGIFEGQSTIDRGDSPPFLTMRFAAQGDGPIHFQPVRRARTFNISLRIPGRSVSLTDSGHTYPLSFNNIRDFERNLSLSLPGNERLEVGPDAQGITRYVFTQAHSQPQNLNGPFSRSRCDQIFPFQLNDHYVGTLNQPGIPLGDDTTRDGIGRLIIRGMGYDLRADVTEGAAQIHNQIRIPSQVLITRSEAADLPVAQPAPSPDQQRQMHQREEANAESLGSIRALGSQDIRLGW